MTKRMLIDDTRPEETRVVVVNGNKVEDVEFESSSRKQIKGNIYIGKVMRIEPSLQAAFVDYGGNKHGFLAFGEIHPDYYNVSEEELAEVEREVDEIIENKKQALKEREEQRERLRAERQARAEAERQRALEAKAEEERLAANEQVPGQEEAQAEDNQNLNQEASSSVDESASREQEAAAAGSQIPQQDQTPTKSEETPRRKKSRNPDRRAAKRQEALTAKNAAAALETVFETESESPAAENGEETASADAPAVSETAGEEGKPQKKRIIKKRFRKQKEKAETKDELKVLSESSGTESDSISEEVGSDNEDDAEIIAKNTNYNNEEDFDAEDDDDDSEYDFELQKKLLKVRKLYHRSSIQDVIKEGQILLVQIVKEERGNKGAALTTYLSLAGRYCVLMPNRIKSGGVSRKITNAADRKRLKAIVRELPLTSEMSMIVRTAGEDKTKADIVRDYNYLIRSWNQIRLSALQTQAPALIHEEGNLIKRALRDMYTKDISEIIVDGENAYKMARDFVKILSPHNLKKIKSCKKDDIPLFQRFQVEGQLDKLHDCNVQLESGGYLVINPTEALVSIDVNSGRATKEKDLEETALKTNLEAADEIAKQLRMRNLAGLIVVDFIDMEEPQNNHAVEKRMKEAMKKDRARVQIAKMSCFGLLEISRQRMHSSFMESNYQTCPHCHGQGVIRTVESSAVMILRNIEEEGIKNRSSRINVTVPAEVALYLLNQKRQTLVELEQKYKMCIVVSADSSITNVADSKIERIKNVKANTPEEDKKSETKAEIQSQFVPEAKEEESGAISEEAEGENSEETNMGSRRRDRRRDRRNRNDRRGRRGDRRGRERYNNGQENTPEKPKEKSEAVILYNSHEDTTSSANSNEQSNKEEKQGKAAWWRKLIG